MGRTRTPPISANKYEEKIELSTLHGVGKSIRESLSSLFEKPSLTTTIKQSYKPYMHKPKRGIYPISS